MTSSDRLWVLGAFTTLMVGAVHVQQFMGEVGDAPTIAQLFLLNGIGAGGIVIGLVFPRSRLLAALGGIGLSAGALVSLAIARYAENGIFDYTEPDLRAPVIVAILSELASVALLSAYLAGARRASSPSAAT
ncbi:MAG: hypothetical protein M3350_09740 [Actinomycetota bacterium]|nr:hypothetical protein [Actinomycetota bacterium]